ncbi:MAG: helix-turn-helix domain-containing protein [Turicibacter sp.]|nr:helix-turn-helix domain-containing protein [Turicibacter sp.]
MNQRIKQVRKEYGLNQKEFGESLGVKREALASYETGRVVPNNTFVQLLCTQYLINEKWLRTGEGCMMADNNDFIKEVVNKYNLSQYAEELLIIYAKSNGKEREIFDRLLEDFMLINTRMRDSSS